MGIPITDPMVANGIFTHMKNHKNQPNVGKIYRSSHGWYGLYINCPFNKKELMVFMSVNIPFATMGSYGVAEIVSF